MKSISVPLYLYNDLMQLKTLECHESLPETISFLLLQKSKNTFDSLPSYALPKLPFALVILIFSFRKIDDVVFSMDKRVNYVNNDYSLSEFIREVYGYFKFDFTRRIYLLIRNVSYYFHFGTGAGARSGDNENDIRNNNQAILLGRDSTIDENKFFINGVNNVTLKSKAFTNIDLEHLSVNLETLYLFHTNINTNGLNFILDNFKNLKSFNIRRFSHYITKEIFRKFKRVKTISLIACRLTDVQLDHMFGKDEFDSSCNKNGKLRNLLVSRNNFSADGCKYFVMYENLRRLRVCNCRVLDKGMEYISRCKQLLEVTVDECGITSVGLEYLLQSPTIERIWSRKNFIGSGTNLFDSILRPHTHNPFIPPYCDSEDSLKNIVNNTTIKWINLHCNLRRMTVNDCIALSKLPKLHTLVLNQCFLKDEHIIGLLTDNHSIKRLYINWNGNLTHKTVEFLSRNRSLEKLAYSQKEFTNEDAKCLFLNNKTLTVLNIPYTKISNECLESLSHNETLRVLKIRSTKIDKNGIEFIKKKCLHLKELYYSQSLDDDNEISWYREYFFL